MLSTRFKDDNVTEIGIDEAGRGSFWGPIMAGAVIIPNESEWSDKHHTLFTELRDSKKISPKKRERIADTIKEILPYTAVGSVDAAEINTYGITWANMEAFRRAVAALHLDDSSKCRLIIDGVLSIDKWDGEQELIVEGDATYLAIAAASILAKVAHDKWIQDYCANNPECDTRYNLSSSKGYGTAKHREGIKQYGGHELHRTLYIQNWLPTSATPPKKKTSVDKTKKCLIKF